MRGARAMSSSGTTGAPITGRPGTIRPRKTAFTGASPSRSALPAHDRGGCGRARRPREDVAMTIAMRQIGPCFAAEVTGIDLTQRASTAEVAAIHAGMDRYAVLV